MGLQDHSYSSIYSLCLTRSGDCSVLLTTDKCSIRNKHLSAVEPLCLFYIYLCECKTRKIQLEFRAAMISRSTENYPINVIIDESLLRKHVLRFLNVNISWFSSMKKTRHLRSAAQSEQANHVFCYSDTVFANIS